MYEPSWDARSTWDGELLFEITFYSLTSQCHIIEINENFMIIVENFITFLVINCTFDISDHDDRCARVWLDIRIWKIEVNEETGVRERDRRKAFHVIDCVFVSKTREKKDNVFVGTKWSRYVYILSKEKKTEIYEQRERESERKKLKESIALSL